MEETLSPSAFLQSGDIGILLTVDDSARQPVTLKSKNDTKGSKPWALWGTNNDLPDKLYKQLKKSTDGSSASKYDSGFHYAQGISYYSRGDGNELTPAQDARVDAWMEDNNTVLQQLELVKNYKILGSGYVVGILSKDRKTVHYQSQVVPSAQVRLAKYNSNGRITKAFLSRDWPTPNEEYYKEIDIVSPLHAVEELRQRTDVYRFLFPVRGIDIFNNYYPNPHWLPAYDSGWLEISALYPETIKALLSNSIRVVYHIEIGSKFLEAKYKGWEGLTDDERKTKFSELRAEIKKHLEGAVNAGSSIMSVITQDRQGNEYPGIKITAVDRKLPEKVLTEDASHVTAQIYTMFGIDPTLAGVALPGGKNLSGSGSDKRQALALHQLLEHPEREITLSWLRFVFKYNGWNYQLRYKDIEMQTLNENPTGQSDAVPV